MKTKNAKTYSKSRNVTTAQDDSVSDFSTIEKYSGRDELSSEEIANLRAKRARSKATGSNAKQKTFIPQDMKDERFFYKWFKSNPAIIDALQNDGWRIVSDRDLSRLKGNNIDTTVQIFANTDSNGNADKMILMRIPKELHEDDVKDVMSNIKKINDQIQSGKLTGEAKNDASQEDFYDPS